jgi:hypothetical protein
LKCPERIPTCKLARVFSSSPAPRLYKATADVRPSHKINSQPVQRSKLFSSLWFPFSPWHQRKPLVAVTAWGPFVTLVACSPIRLYQFGRVPAEQRRRQCLKQCLQQFVAPLRRCMRRFHETDSRHLGITTTYILLLRLANTKSIIGSFQIQPRNGYHLH